MYKVSILVPVHNVENYIERCARSLFGQTYDNLEYVFVDDCSPDKSVDVLERIVDEYPERKPQMKLIRNEANRGASASKNIAIDNATGEFVCFVDSDDWMEPNAVELLVSEQRKTNADVVWGKMMMHTNDGVFEYSEPSYKDKNEWLLCYCRLTTGLVMTNWKRIIRRSLLEQYGIRSAEGFNYSEDKLLMSQVAYYSQSFSSIDKVVYHYNRMNPLQATAKQSGNVFNVDVFRQEYGSINLIEKFFSDKEDVYHEEVARAKLRYLSEKMEEAIRCSSKEGFNVAAGHVRQTSPDLWDEIGWNTWRRMLYGNYCYRKYFKKMKRKVKHFIGR